MEPVKINEKLKKYYGTFFELDKWYGVLICDRGCVWLYHNGMSGVELKHITTPLQFARLYEALTGLPFHKEIFENRY